MRVFNLLLIQNLNHTNEKNKIPSFNLYYLLIISIKLSKLLKKNGYLQLFLFVFL